MLNSMKTKLVTLLLVSGMIGGFLVRLKDVTAPLADWHSFRQADTASVAREYVKHGIDLLRPTYQDLSNIQSGKDNPNGYRMVEFPILNAAVAFIYRSFPITHHLELHVVYRLFDVCLSLCSALLLFLIIRRIGSQTLGLFAALVFLFMPFNVFYSRTVLPEIGLITFSLLGVYAGFRYIDKPGVASFLFAAISLALGLLIKPVAIFFYTPLIGYALDKRGWKSVLNWRLLLLGLVAATPLFLWRQWMLAFPEGIPDSIWLLNGNGIRFKGAWFYWLFADRLGRLMLGYWGTLLVALGVLVKKPTAVIGWWVVGALAYMSVFATGNVQHDYYQIPLIPIVSALVAYGLHWLVTQQSFGKVTSVVMALLILAFSFSFSWYHIRAYYGINNPAIVAAGKAVDRLTPPEALVIAPYMGDTSFLYQTNRRGWPIGFDISDKIGKGAQYYVSVNFDDETNALMSTYRVLEKTSQYVVIDLTATNNYTAFSK